MKILSKFIEPKDLPMITAVHEAGHAVLYHLLGYRIESVFINSTGDGKICCPVITPSGVYTFINDANIKKELMNYGMICLSGYLAEFKYQKRRIKGVLVPCPENENKNDVTRFYDEMSICQNLSGEKFSVGMFCYFVQAELRSLFRKKKIWLSVLALAETICSESGKQLNGDEVHAILEEKIPFALLNR